MWTKVESWKEIPEGAWLVQLESDSWGSPFQVANIRKNTSIIGNVFAFDQKRVIGYHPLPEPMPAPSKDR